MPARPSDCFACHQADYQGTRDPEPRPGGLSRPPARTATRPRPGNRRASTTATTVVPADRRARLGGLLLLPRERLRRHARGLLRLPPGRLPGHERSESLRRGLPDDLPELPLDERLGAGDLQPRDDRVPADRRARDDGLRLLPRLGLRRHADRLLRLPPLRLPGRDRPQPRLGRLPHRLPDLSRDQRLGAGDLQPLVDLVPPDRRAHLHALLLLPRHRLRRHADRLLLLSPGRLPGHERPQPRGGRLPHRLPELPQHHELGGRQLRPRRPVLPDLLGRAPGQVVLLLDLPRGRLELLDLRVHGLPRAQPVPDELRAQRRLRLPLGELGLLPVPPRREGR